MIECILLPADNRSARASLPVKPRSASRSYASVVLLLETPRIMLETKSKKLWLRGVTDSGITAENHFCICL